jgi:hypothetical protein
MSTPNPIGQAHAAHLARELTLYGPWCGDNQTVTVRQVIDSAHAHGLDLTAEQAEAAIDAARNRTLVHA